MSFVYACMCADIVHHGHVALIKKASDYGNLIVGLLTDIGIASYKPPPIMTFEERKLVVEYMKGVWMVVPQDSLDYGPNLRKYRPNYVIHGNDWHCGMQKDLDVREKVKSILEEWGGAIIDAPYTPGINSSDIRNRIKCR